MTEIATIDWFGRWETSVNSENTAIFLDFFFFFFLPRILSPVIGACILTIKA